MVQWCSEGTRTAPVLMLSLSSPGSPQLSDDRGRRFPEAEPRAASTLPARGHTGEAPAHSRRASRHQRGDGHRGRTHAPARSVSGWEGVELSQTFAARLRRARFDERPGVPRGGRTLSPSRRLASGAAEGQFDGAVPIRSSRTPAEQLLVGKMCATSSKPTRTCWSPRASCRFRSHPDPRRGCS